MNQLDTWGGGGSLLFCVGHTMECVWCMGGEAWWKNAMECVVHGCDVLNKRGFARPFCDRITPYSVIH